MENSGVTLQKAVSWAVVFYTLLICAECTEDDPDLPAGNEALMGAIYSLNSCMETLYRPEFINEFAVQRLLHAYRVNSKGIEIVPTPAPEDNRLFIAVEGSMRRKRFHLARKLAIILGGNVFFHPPRGFGSIRYDFNLSIGYESVLLSRTYHALCLYATANNIRRVLPTRHAIVSGYWFDQANFAIAKKYYPNVPRNTSSVWTWPKDLLKPTFVFYLNERNPTPDPIKKNEFLNQMAQIYRQWKDPRVIEITDPIDYERALKIMVEYVRRYLDPNTTPSG